MNFIFFSKKLFYNNLQRSPKQKYAKQNLLSTFLKQLNLITF